MRADAAYQALRAAALEAASAGRDELALRRVGEAARLACFAHTGRFADGTLEGIAIRIGQGSSALAVQPGVSRRQKVSGDVRRVLHVVSRALPTGGHTRLVLNWIANDVGSRHSVVVLAQGRTPIPAFIERAVEAGGGTLARMPRSHSMLERAQRLRHLAMTQADTVILHAHQFDAVPLVAFAAEECPPVGFVNHADHMFWLGSSVADAVISIRRFGNELAQRRRFARHPHILPIPMAPERPVIKRQAARASLSITDDAIVLLTVGSRYKYTADGRYDFFETIGKILVAEPRAILLVVGLHRADMSGHPVVAALADRIRFFGECIELAVFHGAADIYLDAFPYSSFTAVLEAAAAGVCPVLMYDPVPQQYVADDPGFSGLSHAGGEAPYVAHVQRLVDEESLRHEMAARTASAVTRHHRGVEWIARLSSIYAELDAIGHHPLRLPPTEPQIERADADRLEWDRVMRGELPLTALGLGGMDGPRDLAVLAVGSVRRGETRVRLPHVRAWLGACRRVLGFGDL
jgi:glycosyltransferase involved in cell wall biosynthesis